MDPVVKNAKLFMVGAGGIGCELLKNLVMSGFDDIELIDMDTIDVSNLNRQFLFRQKHVGMSKAKVARDAALAMRPSARIVAHHGNVTAPEYDVDFFAQFSVVLNALDNVAARRHVNRLCLAAGVPLVDSGTAGFLGQVSTHIKGVSQCYECEPKPAPKGFPTCTITNTPSKPVHCIVWAKELPFQKLFGDKSTPSDLDTLPSSTVPAPPPQEPSSSDPAGTDSAAAAAAAGAAPAAAPADAGDPPGDFFAPRQDESLGSFGRRVFDRLFGDNVAETLKMDDMWRHRARPTPHYLAHILRDAPGEPAAGDGLGEPAAGDAPGAPAGGATEGARAEGGDGVPAAASAETAAADAPSGCGMHRLGLSDDHAVWSLEDNARLFLECIRAFFETRKQDIGSLTFDKDDDLAVQFVVSASNIRAHSFGIPMQSLFAVKGIAGSIVHAVATTNAIVGGLATLQTIKILRGETENPPTVWCRALKNSMGRLIEATDKEPPHPACRACSQATLVLELDTTRIPLSAVLASVVKQQLGAAYPTLTCGDALLYEEGADLEPEEVAAYASNAKKVLSRFAQPIRHGSVLTVEDYQQRFKCDIHIKHREDINVEEHPSGMILHGAEEAKRASANRGGGGEGEGEEEEEEEDDDDLQVVEVPEEPVHQGGVEGEGGGDGGHRKRPRVDGIESGDAGKKAKVDVVELD